MRRRIISTFAAMVSTACGDYTLAEVEPAAFEELCGHEGPVQILPLAVDPNFKSAGGQLVGDRYLFTVRAAFEGRGPYASLEDLWSVGRCGEDPVLLVDNGLFNWVGNHPDYDNDVVFICDESSGWITALDVHGTVPPNEVIATRDCFSLTTDFGVLTVPGYSDTGPLMLHRWPADPLTEAAEQIMLVDAVRVWAEPSPERSNERDVLAVTATEAFAVTANDELVVVDLETLVVTTLAQDVRKFDVGSSGHFLIWQGLEITSDDDPDWPQGPIFVLDRESGQATEIDQTALAFTLGNPLQLERLGLLHYRAGYWNDEGADRWLRLPSLEPYSMDGRLQPLTVLDETRALLNDLMGGPTVMLDTATAEFTTIYDGPSSGPAFYSFDTEGNNVGLLIQTEEYGALVRVDYSGESHTLAHHVTPRYFVANDDRVVTASAVYDDSDVGRLVIVDPETLDERVIAEQVYALSSMPLEQDEGLIVGYLHADPDRYGIWLAKPAK
jgi:hypothetical protein